MTDSNSKFTEESMARALVARGHKLTRPRRAVLKVVAESGATLTAADIHRLAQGLYPKTGLVTVYRTLDMLAELGAVRKVHQSDGCHSYAPASEGHGHHVICENCHAVTEFDNCDLADMLAAVQQRTGFTIQGHWLELFGSCPNCNAENR
jgi:Fur family transcriptional regulator, ferric uptake regulator